MAVAGYIAVAAICKTAADAAGAGVNNTFQPAAVEG